ncbi:MAG: hypothetical protein WDW36_004124 [Sanguina aurantia]
MARALLLVLAVALLSRTQASLYSSSDAVISLDEGGFDALMQADGVAVVEFMAPWCGHCKSLAPHYKAVAKSLKGLAVVAAVDCDDKNNANLCSKQNIKGFPTLQLFGPSKELNANTKEYTKEAIPYDGPRTAKPISEAVTALLTDLHITRIVTEPQLDTFLASQPGSPKVLLFTSKPASTPLYKALSLQLHSKLGFGEAQGSASAVLERYGVKDLPMLVVVQPDGSTDGYTGDYKAPQLLAFLQSFLPKEDARPSGTKQPINPLPHLTLDDFDKADQDEGMALVGFYAGSEGPCTAQLAQLAKAAKDMQAVAPVGVVNVTAHWQPPVDGASTPTLSSEHRATLTRLGVDVARLASGTGCEIQVVLLPFGADKAELEDYQVYTGAVEGKAMQAFVTDAMPSFAFALSASSLNAFMSAPAGDGSLLTTKMVLFTSKKEVPGVYKALAMNFRQHGSIAFAWVQSTDATGEMLMKQFKVTKVPSLVAVLPQELSGGAEEEAGGGDRQRGLQVQPYFGPMKYNGMADFLVGVAPPCWPAIHHVRGSLFDSQQRTKEPNTRKEEAEEKRRCPHSTLAPVHTTRAHRKSPRWPASPAALLRPPVAGAGLPQVHIAQYMDHIGGKAPAGLAVEQLTPHLQDDPALAARCTAQPGLCLLALLDPAAAGHGKTLQSLALVAARREGQPLHFGWIDARGQQPLLSAFNVLRSDLPTLVAVSPSKLRFAVSQGDSITDTKRMDAFIDGVLSAKIRTSPLQAMPGILGSVSEAPQSDSSSEPRGGGSGSGPGSVPEAEEAQIVEEEEFDLSDVMGEELGSSLASASDRVAQVDRELEAEKAERASAAAQDAKKKKKKKRSKKKSDSEL